MFTKEEPVCYKIWDMVGRLSSVTVWLTHPQKDDLIRASVASGCGPNAIVSLAVKELLDKGTVYIHETIGDEDFKADELIKKNKEDRIL